MSRSPSCTTNFFFFATTTAAAVGTTGGMSVKISNECSAFIPHIRLAERLWQQQAIVMLTVKSDLFYSQNTEKVLQISGFNKF